MEGITLNECPFCGSIDLLLFRYEDEPNRIRFVKCNQCNANGPFIDRDDYETPLPGGVVDNAEENINLWNDRVCKYKS